MPGKLYVVPTDWKRFGYLPAAIDILGGVELIAAEDTRTSARC